MKSIKVSAPRKLHLLGEHAVVYGKPALLAAVDKRCFVEITPRKDKVIEIISKELNIAEKVDEKIILQRTKQAKKIWNVFSKSNTIAVLKKIIKQPGDFLFLIIGETLLYYKKSFTTGFTLTVTCDLPMSSGMGSSSAIAVSIAAALTLFLKEKFDKEKINYIAFLAEHYIHGFPSGGDNSVSCFGGFVWYRKETASLKIIQPVPLQIAKEIANNFYIYDTGIPKESTGEMVALVRQFVIKHPELAKKVFSDQELLTRNFLLALQDGDEKEIIKIIRAGEKNLEKIGAVSPFVKKTIREIEKAGGAAKICGGGGKKKATGILLVYQKNKQNKKYASIQLGSEGVRLENEKK